MTWPDVIRSVEARIHDSAAQDRELRMLYLEGRMVGFEPNSVMYTVHCAACHWDSVTLGDEAPQCCLRCGATDPEVVDVRRLPPVHDSLRDREH